MVNWILFTILAVVSYFIGNINNAIWISKLKKNDIRNLGSGNPGTMNMSRNFGLKIGILTLLLDALKGAIPALIGYFVFVNKSPATSVPFDFADFAKYALGLCAVLGHIFPILFKFKGGKGIATTIGAMMVCSCTSGVAIAIIAVMSMVAAVLFIYYTEFGAMGSFIAITPPAIANSIYLYVKYAGLPGIRSQDVYYMISCGIIGLICFITWLAHRKNIERMLKGEEHATSIKTMIFKHKQKKLAQKAKMNNENEQ